VFGAGGLSCVLSFIRDKTYELFVDISPDQEGKAGEATEDRSG